MRPSYELVRFTAAGWQPGGHPLERKIVAASGGASVLEFAPGFADPNWCTNGHAGIVLSGELALEFAGETLRVAAGDGFVIEAGERHRASNPGGVPVRLFVAARSDS